MTKKQEQGSYIPEESIIDEVMELFLQGKSYSRMKHLLNQVSSTYNKYDYYLNKIKEANKST